MDSLSSRIAALELDGSPKAVATLRYIQAILDGEVVIPGGIAMLMGGLACDGYVNAEIDDAHFPGADPFVSIEGVVPITFTVEWTDAEATARLAAMTPPMISVMPDKGIRWAAANPAAQTRAPLVILGQKGNHHGHACVIVLGKDARGRDARLYNAQEQFNRSCCILAEPKKLLVPGT